jgi:hypothetical protein
VDLEHRWTLVRLLVITLWLLHAPFILVGFLEIELPLPLNVTYSGLVAALVGRLAAFGRPGDAAVILYAAPVGAVLAIGEPSVPMLALVGALNVTAFGAAYFHEREGLEDGRQDYGDD